MTDNSRTVPVGISWTELHRELVRRCRAAGLLNRARELEWLRALGVVTLYTLSFLALLRHLAWPARLGWLILLTFASVQAGMIAHDIGHAAFSVGRGRRSPAGQLFMTFLNGWPFSHWTNEHDAHHRHTNVEGRDPDMEEGMFALSVGAAAHKSGWTRLTVRQQHILLWPLATLMPFPIRIRACVFLWRRRRTPGVDPWVMMLHLVVWLVLPAAFIGPNAALVNYLVWTWMMGPYLIASFFWNHVGTRVVLPNEKLPFFFHRLVCTRNIRGHWLLTLMFGGLNYHTEHHLIPSAPIANLGRVRRILIELCDTHGVPYREYGYLEALAGVHRQLRAVARSLPHRSARAPWA